MAKAQSVTTRAKIYDIINKLDKINDVATKQDIKELKAMSRNLEITYDQELLRDRRVYEEPKKQYHHLHKDRDYIAGETAKVFIDAQMRYRRMSLLSRILYYLNLKGWKADHDIDSRNIATISYEVADDLIRRGRGINLK